MKFIIDIRDRRGSRGPSVFPPSWVERAVDLQFVAGGVCASAERCIRKAVPGRSPASGPVGLADATAEDEAASRWADCAVAYGD